MLTIGESCANIKSSIKDVANIFSVFPGWSGRSDCFYHDTAGHDYWFSAVTVFEVLFAAVLASRLYFKSVFSFFYDERRLVSYLAQHIKCDIGAYETGLL